MPTPFTHLVAAQQLRDDPHLPQDARDLIERELSAFLLGNVARESTHFFTYDLPIVEHPWRVMLDSHPTLRTPTSDAQRAFLAGYTAHLAMDELWSIEMVRPHFVAGDWGDRRLRFLMLHIILIYMDEADYGRLHRWQRDVLATAAPQEWIPFLNDDTLAEWRDLISAQLPPGKSQTLEVFGERINVPPAVFRSILDTPAQMQADLWNHVSPDLLATTQQRMVDHARGQMMDFLLLTQT
jgi:hypothetical protein